VSSAYGLIASCLHPIKCNKLYLVQQNAWHLCSTMLQVRAELAPCESQMAEVLSAIDVAISGPEEFSVYIHSEPCAIACCRYELSWRPGSLKWPRCSQPLTWPPASVTCC
jgi:hypothetical protein